ncbi:uncharacterized protein LOC109860509 isoform X2 [Pseudomyrmex gracilis]|uniref:uncharacterized protein LOC109860509 isoform X2 n=1 Tax=Pseudomyrmex gracilis TaxID=219809 RepID=UPI0009952B0B|nr:uncharacterized protein LOC109860509 isoform X2 [Pseudomyrmex gracilis]
MSKRVFLDPLVPRVRRCNACQRFGHLAQYCRSGTAPHRIICERCCEKGHAKSVCTGPARCINCIRAQLDRVDHEASAGTCPSFLKEKGIRMIMARFNVLRPEADEIYIECGGVPGRRWTRYSRAIPNPTLGDFLPPRTTAPSYADVVAAPSSKHPPVEIPDTLIIPSTFDSWRCLWTPSAASRYATPMILPAPGTNLYENPTFPMYFTLTDPENAMAWPNELPML